MISENQYDVSSKDIYMKLSSLIDQICIDLDLSVSHYFNRLLSWGCLAIMDLHLDNAQSTKTVLLPINDVCQCNLPEDFVDWCIIGIPFGQYIKTLSVNDQLSAIPRTIENWNPNQRFPPGWLPDGVDMMQYSAYQLPNFGGRGLVSFGGGLPHRGHYKIVNSGGCKTLLLDVGLPATSIYLSYIGLGISACGETILEPAIYEYVRAYIHHQYEQFGKRLDKSEAAIQRTGRNLWHQRMVAIGRQNSISPTDLLTISRKSYRLTNKA